MNNVEKYKIQTIQLSGKRVKCIEMTDDFPVPPDTEGTITHVDDIGTIHVNWDNGSTLGLLPHIDKYQIL